MIDDLFSIGSFTAKSLRRSILNFTRRPIDYNFARMPEPDQFRDMELAFLEDYFEPPKISKKHAWPYIKYTAYALFLIVGYVLLGLNIILTLVMVCALMAPALFVTTSRNLLNKSQTRLSVGIILVLLLAGAFFVANLFQYTPLVFIAFGVPLIFLLRFISSDFYNFSIQWLYAHPCLHTKERKALLTGATCPRFPIGFFFTILFAVPVANHFLPCFPVLLGIYAALALAIVKGPLYDACATQRQPKWEEFFRATLQFIAEYFTYGRRFPKPLPGVWYSGRSHLIRRRLFVLLLLLLLITTAAATNFFFAWDTPGFRASYEEMFIRMAYRDSKGLDDVKEHLTWVDWSQILSAEEIEDAERDIKRLEGAEVQGDLNAQIDRMTELDELRSKVLNNESRIREVAAEWYRTDTPSWIYLATSNLVLHPVISIGSFFFAFLNALIIPLLFLIAASQRILLELARAHGALQSRIAEETARSPWEWFVDRLRASQHIAPDPQNSEINIREADHLFLGVEASNGFPVLLHRPILNEHVYLSGGSGSGKTSLGILSLLAQLIRGGTENGPDNGAMPPIVIIDMKGEYALLHSVREEVRKKAEQEGRSLEDCFRLFTCEKGMPTHYFNPLGDMTYPDRYVADLANLLLDALELNHGPGYGRSYYSRKNYMLLHELLSSNNPANFDELCERISKSTAQNKDDRHQAFELMATLYGLLEFDQLRPPADMPESAMISMRQVVEQRQVVYFWLPTVESSIIAREIANLALFSYFSAMRARTKQRLPQRQAYLVVDEFQKLAGDRFSVILQQARGFGLSTILSNQSIADLKTPTYDLRSAINQNTRLKLYFSFSDCREMNDFAKRSGEELAYMRSGVYDLAGDQEPDAPLFNQWRHEIKSRVTTNDMLQVTDHPLQAFMDVRAGSGYTQFGGATLPLQMFHPIRWSEFQKRRDELPWPTREELGTALSTCSNVSTEEVDDRAAAVLSKLDERIQAFDMENPHLRYS